MEFDIIMVTRNRQKVLPLSLPLILSQSRLPQNLIIVDSSDRHEEVKQIVETLVHRAEVKSELHIIRSTPGSAYQRNIGLRHAKSPVVMFPDDDALWFPGVADSIMKIYERDENKLIGAVCASESRMPPFRLFGRLKLRYQMELRDKLQIRLACKFNAVEKALFPDPFFLEGEEKMKYKARPSWLRELGATISGPMTGFRMSFRKEMIEPICFDESLGRYSLFEDRDASLGIMHDSLIVRSENAKVFHFRSPEKRVNGIEWGVMHVLNRAYVVCKHTHHGSQARRLLRRYSYYKLLRYLLQAQTQYGRHRVIGAWRAIRKISCLDNSTGDDLPKKYLEARRNCLN